MFSLKKISYWTYGQKMDLRHLAIFRPSFMVFLLFFDNEMYMRLMYNILKDPETFLVFRMPKRQFLKNWT